MIAKSLAMVLSDAPSVAVVSSARWRAVGVEYAVVRQHGNARLWQPISD
jgi:hypothetical protein